MDKQFKKLLEYGLIGVIISFLVYLFVISLQIEKLDHRIVYFVIFVLLWTFYLKNKKVKSFVGGSFQENPLFSRVFLICFLVVLPFLLRDQYLIHICIMVGLYLIMALGMNMFLGSFGLMNFCFGAYFGIGAYTSALLSTHFHLSFWITLVLGGIVSLLGGLFVSLLTLKNKGYYYALITFAFQLVFNLLLVNFGWTGGPDGVNYIPPPAIGSYSFGEPLNLFGVSLPFQANFYYLTLFLALLTVFVAVRINASKTALVWNSIREDEIAASCQGINIFPKKLEVSAVGAFFGGLAGPLYAHYIGYISPEVFTYEVCVVLLSMIVMGGLNSIPGVILGAAILTVLPEKFQLVADYRTFIYGLVLLFILIFKPGGFIPEKVREYGDLIAKPVLPREE